MPIAPTWRGDPRTEAVYELLSLVMTGDKAREATKWLLQQVSSGEAGGGGLSRVDAAEKLVGELSDAWEETSKDLPLEHRQTLRAYRASATQYLDNLMTELDRSPDIPPGDLDRMVRAAKSQLKQAFPMVPQDRGPHRAALNDYKLPKVVSENVISRPTGDLDVRTPDLAVADAEDEAALEAMSKREATLTSRPDRVETGVDEAAAATRAAQAKKIEEDLRKRAASTPAAAAGSPPDEEMRQIRAEAEREKLRGAKARSALLEEKLRRAKQVSTPPQEVVDAARQNVDAATKTKTNTETKPPPGKTTVPRGERFSVRKFLGLDRLSKTVGLGVVEASEGRIARGLGIAAGGLGRFATTTLPGGIATALLIGQAAKYGMPGLTGAADERARVQRELEPTTGDLIVRSMLERARIKRAQEALRQNPELMQQLMQQSRWKKMQEENLVSGESRVTLPGQGPFSDPEGVLQIIGGS